MFKRKNEIIPKHTIDELYDLLVGYIDIQTTEINKLKSLNSLADKSNAELAKAIEGKNKLLEEKEYKNVYLTDLLNGYILENQKLNNKIDKLEKKCTELSDFIKGYTERLIEAQLKFKNRSKPTKADYIADGMNKMDSSTKARLK